MSNQVYSNEHNKYYDFPGLNNYLLSGNVLGIPSPHTQNIFFNNPNIVNDSSMVDTSTETITFNRDGMYSIMINVAIALDPAAAGTILYILQLKLDRPGQFTGLNIQESVNKYIAVAGSTTSIACLSASLYFKQGDLMTVSLTNASGTTIQIVATGTSMIINKLF